MGTETYCQAVEVAKEHILAGDIFEMIVAQRFDLDLDAHPFDVYRVLRQVNPSPYMYFVRQPGVTLVGSSPEPLVKLLDGTVISRPIAGTRRRGRTDEEDRRMAAELVEHPKEIAEHIMLVDLARNDVGRVVEYGSVSVDEMMTLERYSHVMHMTSQVSGQLRPGKTAIDVLRATLPAGTVSGAPKVRAMEIIDSLEPTKRGPYAGVVGYLDFSGNIDTAIAIRTLVVSDDGRASVQAGAGIVADSVPEHEDLECHNKARALLAAIPAARRMTARRRAHAGGSSVARWVASGPWGTSTCGPRWARLPCSGTSSRCRGLRQRRSCKDSSARMCPPWGSTPRRCHCCCNPPARSMRGSRVTRTADDHFLLDLEAGFGDAVLARLQRFKLRTKAELGLEHWSGLALRGPGAAAIEPPSGSHALAVAWPGVDGVDLLSAGELALAGVPLVDTSMLDALRIECGVPAMGAELTEATIPAEAGQWLIDCVRELHEGLLHGSGAGRPHRQPRRQRAAAGPRVCWSTVTSCPWAPPSSSPGPTSAPSRRRRGRAVLGAIALVPLARSVEPGTAVDSPRRMARGRTATAAELPCGETARRAPGRVGADRHRLHRRRCGAVAPTTRATTSTSVVDRTGVVLPGVDGETTTTIDETGTAPSSARCAARPDLLPVPPSASIASWPGGRSAATSPPRPTAVGSCGQCRAAATGSARSSRPSTRSGGRGPLPRRR